MKDRPRPASSGVPSPLAGIVANDSRGLGRIAERARRIAAMKSALWPLIPSDLRPHCDLANYRNGVIVITASSPVWATRVRHASAGILHTVRAKFQIRADRVEVRVVPPAGPATVTKARRTLSDAARQSLERAAASTADDSLSAAMKRLLER